MCGIIGYTGRRHSKDLLIGGLERLEFRGYDSAGIVLNGIVENYLALKGELERTGHVFSSETDAEVVAHLVESLYAGDLVAAVRATYERLEGHFTFVVVHHDEPQRLVGVRHQTPLVVGLADGENFLASNVMAFLSETKRVQYPQDGQIVDVLPDRVRFVDAATGADVTVPDDE